MHMELLMWIYQSICDTWNIDNKLNKPLILTSSAINILLTSDLCLWYLKKIL